MNKISLFCVPSHADIHRTSGVDGIRVLWYHLSMKVELSGRIGNGRFFAIDDDDADKVNKHTWWLDNRLRPQTDIWDKIKKKSFRVLASRLIMNPKKGMVVDHIDGNTLNNTKRNLRICTQLENQKNRNNLNKNNTSGFRGVSWDKARNKWTAQLSLKYKHIYLGRFDSIEEARNSVKNAVRKYHGAFANINNI